MRKVATVLLSILLLLGVTSALRAQSPGTPDPTFGTNGLRTYHIDQDDHCSVLKTDSLGRIYLGGYVLNHDSVSDQDFMLARLHPDGDRDSSFAVDGLLRGDFPGLRNARVVDFDFADDGIYFICNANNGGSQDTQNVYIGKVLPDGSWDNTFGFNGILRPKHLSAFDAAGGLRVLPDGKLLYYGMTLDTLIWHIEMPLVGRLWPDGRPDSSFAGTGRVVWRVGNGLSSIRMPHIDGGRLSSMLELDDGYLFGGHFFTLSNAQGFLLRLDSAGAMDTTFGQGGTMFPNLAPGSDQDILGLSQKGNRIYMAISVDVLTGGRDFYLAAMDPDGGNMAFETIDFGGREDLPQGLMQDQYGQLLSFGYSRDTSSNAPGYASDAMVIAASIDLQTLSPGFAAGGRFSYDPNPGQEIGATALVETIDGKLLLAGYIEATDSANFSDIVLLRLSNGPLVGREGPLPVAPLAYPNPVRDRLWLREAAGMEPLRVVHIYDLQGRPIHDGPIGPEGLDVRNWPHGCYLLRAGDFRQRILKVE